MSTKLCGSCKQEKSITDFGFRDKGKTKRRSYCEECGRKMHNDWYARHAEDRRPKIHAHTKAQRQHNIDLVLNYLASHPCVDCGEADVRVLEFDHRDPDAKEGDISRLISFGGSGRRLMAEIEKCDVRCANCHRKRHAGPARSIFWVKQMGA